MKLRVEELYYYGNNGSGTIAKDYILQNIKEEKLSERKRVSNPLHSDSNSSTNTVSELYKLVNEFDEIHKIYTKPNKFQADNNSYCI